MSIIITILIAPVILIIGNWISIIPSMFLSSIFPKSYNLDKYLVRICMGGSTGILFGLAEHLGANNSVLWIVFVLSLFLPVDPNYRGFSFKVSHAISFFICKNLMFFLLL